MKDALMEVFNRGLATKYGMKTTELNEVWPASWSVYASIVLGLSKTQTRTEKHKAKKATQAAFGHLHQVLKGRPVTGGTGQSKVARRPLAGEKYVVFSDHHIAFPGHRHYNVWQANLPVYEAALNAYFSRGYTLVENGDVEELIIFEPQRDYAGGQEEARLRASLATLSELKARRQVMRLAQLKLILDDPAHAGLLDLWRQFAGATTSEGHSRLVRVAGNHDYDLQQDGAYLHEYRSTHGIPLAQPVDYLVIGKDRPYIVMHGHQFDESSNPTSAPRFGETISECLGIYYQGADRFWPVDEARKWANGSNVFLNEFVGDDPRWLPVGDVDEWFLERLFGHNVAWEYFEHDSESEAMEKEILAGKRWMKFRHTDELFIWYHLRNYPLQKRPRLVLGHTHEVRNMPCAPNGYPQDCYLNSGSAGRFENLVWGLEIEEGAATVVSWSMNDDGVIKRRAWTPGKKKVIGQGNKKRGVLVPDAQSSPFPP